MSGGQDEASNDIESSGGNTIKCPHCLETLDYDERGRNWLCERCGILWSSKLWSHRMSQRKAEIEREMCEGIGELVDTLKEKNDVEEKLDLSKPCEGLVGKKWVPCLHPVYDVSSGLYGAYVISGSHTQHYWLSRPGIRNIRTPQYEPHTMESLLPLAGEWVQPIRNDVALRIVAVTRKSVWVGGLRIAEWSYDDMKSVFTWATGPHAGKPVAREVV